VGVFDGVHLGHQEVLNALAAWARERGGRSVVITFEQHPKAVLRQTPPSFITSLQHRLRLFADMGIDVCVVLDFDEALAQTEPEAFARDVLCAWAGARGVLLGHDQRFGRMGRGDVDLMRRLGAALGLEVRSMPPRRVADRIVSSTAIRKAIAAGDLDAASDMLGRPVSVLGTVVRGCQKGRALGFPTANLDVHHEVQLPEGVYAAFACVEGRCLPSVANIGRRPSFSTVGPAYLDEQPVVEVHVLDFEGDLYGRDVEVRFLSRLRDELPFREEGALRRQVAQDIAEAHAFFGRTGGRGRQG